MIIQNFDLLPSFHSKSQQLSCLECLVNWKGVFLYITGKWIENKLLCDPRRYTSNYFMFDIINGVCCVETLSQMINILLVRCLEKQHHIAYSQTIFNDSWNAFTIKDHISLIMKRISSGRNVDTVLDNVPVIHWISIWSSFHIQFCSKYNLWVLLQKGHSLFLYILTRLLQHSE